MFFTKLFIISVHKPGSLHQFSAVFMIELIHKMNNMQVYEYVFNKNMSNNTFLFFLLKQLR